MAISQKWKDTVKGAIDDARWDEYDPVLQKEITAYSGRFKGKNGFASPSLNLLKAMLWTESGGPDNAVWTKRVLQIGNQGDPAYDVLKKGAEGSHLIMDESLAKDIKAGKLDEPKVNIRAGLAYLYTRMAKFEIKSVRSKTDTKIHDYKVEGGDSYSKIAGKVGTTVAELRESNPDVDPKLLKIGQVLKYHKASMQTVITGWRTFNADTVADRYNGGGDPDYAAKLKFILSDVIPKLKRPKK